MAGPSLPDKVVAIHEALHDAGIAHALGGAIALAYYAEPRATFDVDVNVFVAPSERAAVAACLEPLGVATSGGSIERDGQVRWRWGRNPIDVFFAYDPFHDAMRDAVRSVPFGSHRIPILGPEHLVMCKVVFDRAKDWIDIEQVLTVVDDFDVDDTRHWLDRLLPPNDARAGRFDSLVAELV